MTGFDPSEKNPETPVVSVLLPVRDAVDTLPAALESIRRQTEPAWECIVVDDGSRDGGAAVAESFVARDPRFRLMRAGREGLVPALNAGLSACRGRYVARMDADDLMHRDRLRDQRGLLDGDPGLAGAGCHVRMFPREGLAEGTRAYESWINGITDEALVRREAFVECPIAHPTLMVRREALETPGYRDAGWPEDYDLILRLLAAGRRLSVLPRRRLGWRRHPRQHSRVDERYSIAAFTRCRAAFLAAGFLADHPRYILWGHGGTGRALRRELIALGHEPSHIVEVHPGRVGNRIGNAEVVPVAALGELPRVPLIVSVSGLENRSLIRDELERLGFRETLDFVCAA